MSVRYPAEAHNAGEQEVVDLHLCLIFFLQVEKFLKLFLNMIV